MIGSRMSLAIEHTLHVEEPESAYTGVVDTQSLVLGCKDGSTDVIFYFYLNSALEIVGSRVTSGMGRTKFRLMSESEDNALCASVSFRKVRFKLPSGVAVAQNIELVT